MSEEADLQARIAALSGKIDQRKQLQQPFAQSPQYPHNHPYAPQSYHGTGRWAPYSRGGRGAHQPPHRNITLVLGGHGAPPATTVLSQTTAATAIEPPNPTGELVRSRGINKQLMTKETYEREQKQKLLRAAKQQKRNTEEQHKILRHFDTTPGQASREMVISGVRFKLSDNGSKLMRVNDPDGVNAETPKRTKVAGVDFFRTKHGNLVRAGTLPSTARPAKQTPPCENFTKHGTCPFGSRCHFTHDPQKVAICKDFAKSATCPRGANCDLSHEMTYHRVPACLFFVAGHCTKRACRYPHVHVSPAASVCRPFATLGYCVRGPDCDKRHVLECPDFANHGFCANRENGKCALPHPDRASVLRKAAERQAKMASGEESDMTSDEDDQDYGEMGDVDSDAEDVVMTGSADDGRHELTQQHDFVGFS